jgi:hypothetical protein
MIPSFTARDGCKYTSRTYDMVYVMRAVLGRGLGHAREETVAFTSLQGNAPG